MLRKLGFFAITLAFALLYIATSKEKVSPCGEDCSLLSKADDLLRNNGRIQNTLNCGVKKYCVYVSDTAKSNVQIAADTTCTVLKSVGALNYEVLVLRFGGAPNYKVDTLLQKKCL
jgi:hypothetical protein